MIDLHFHCLPGIDDGPADWSDAVELCRRAAAEGTTAIVATPHVLRDPWINEDAAARERLLRELNDRLAGSPTVYPGCEYYFSADAVELWEAGAGGPLVGLGGSNALLVEFGADVAERTVESVFHEFVLMGVVPVIAHPERNPAFMESPSWLASLVERGARVQITAASVAGDFGARSRAATDELFASGLVHFVASDAHGVGSRPPRLAAARERVEREWGSDATEGIFDRNPRALLAGERLPWVPAPLLRRRS